MRKMGKLTLIMVLPAAVLFSACTGSPGDSQNVSIGNRLRILEDREEIRQLLVDYGRTIDARDFDGFANLFSKDAEYAGGGGGDPVKGSEAIAGLLKNIIEENPTGLKSPNYHLFANEIIQVDGDEAAAVSKGIFVVPGNNGQPDPVMLATYEDKFVRENGKWKFKSRIVRSDMPSLE